MSASSPLRFPFVEWTAQCIYRILDQSVVVMVPLLARLGIGEKHYGVFLDRVLDKGNFERLHVGDDSATHLATVYLPHDVPTGPAWHHTRSADRAHFLKRYHSRA